MGHLPCYFNEFIYKNQFVTKIDTHIKFIEKNQRKQIICKTARVKNIVKKLKNIIFKNKFNLYKILKKQKL
jgi:flagellar basal body P-ring protein FlgI